MESVYKLSVILNLVDNLSGQMNSVQSSVSRSLPSWERGLKFR